MNIAVTGAAGFIGSHLAEQLQREGHRVWAIDDLNDFYAPGLKLKNLNDVLSHGCAEFVHTDVRDADRISELFRAVRPDAVCHLAARAGVRASLEEPLLYESVNVAGTISVLEASRRAGVRKFIFASSSSVYGIAERAPFCESDCIEKPISPYAATKVAGEKMCFTYHHLYNLPVICLRLFSVYGPRQRPDLAIHKFTESISSGSPVPLYGNGSAGRDYTHVGDVVRAIVSGLNYNCNFDVINVGSCRPIPTIEVIRTIEAVVGRRAVIERLPAHAGDVPLTFADIQKARTKLNYEPKISFEYGISDFVNWRRQQNDGPPHATHGHTQTQSLDCVESLRSITNNKRLGSTN
jgi:UDP-glucuronate 4-epimerase